MGSKSTPSTPVRSNSPDAVPIDSSVHQVLFKCGPPRQEERANYNYPVFSHYVNCSAYQVINCTSHHLIMTQVCHQLHHSAVSKEVILLIDRSLAVSAVLMPQSWQVRPSTSLACALFQLDVRIDERHHSIVRTLIVQSCLTICQIIHNRNSESVHMVA